jgi:hypothetical protein
MPIFGLKALLELLNLHKIGTVRNIFNLILLIYTCYS